MVLQLKSRIKVVGTGKPLGTHYTQTEPVLNVDPITRLLAGFFKHHESAPRRASPTLNDVNARHIGNCVNRIDRLAALQPRSRKFLGRGCCGWHNNAHPFVVIATTHTHAVIIRMTCGRPPPLILRRVVIIEESALSGSPNH